MGGQRSARICGALLIPRCYTVKARGSAHVGLALVVFFLFCSIFMIFRLEPEHLIALCYVENYSHTPSCLKYTNTAQAVKSGYFGTVWLVANLCVCVPGAGLFLCSGRGWGDAEGHPCMVTAWSNKTKVSFLGKSWTWLNAPMAEQELSLTCKSWHVSGERDFSCIWGITEFLFLKPRAKIFDQWA